MNIYELGQVIAILDCFSVGLGEIWGNGCWNSDKTCPSTCQHFSECQEKLSAIVVTAKGHGRVHQSMSLAHTKCHPRAVWLALFSGGWNGSSLFKFLRTAKVSIRMPQVCTNTNRHTCLFSLYWVPRHWGTFWYGSQKYVSGSLFKLEIVEKTLYVVQETAPRNPHGQHQ